MLKIILAVTMVALQWMPYSAFADTIYSWKGQDGTLRFSSEPPPEGVTEYQATSSQVTDAINPSSENKRRPSYDAMVEKASQEADQSRQERLDREAAQAAEEKRIAEKKRQERIQTERKRLEKQIEAVKQRAVSPTYPNGMKQAQIEALTKKIEKLAQDAGSADKKSEAGKE